MMTFPRKKVPRRHSLAWLDFTCAWHRPKIARRSLSRFARSGILFPWNNFFQKRGIFFTRSLNNSLEIHIRERERESNKTRCIRRDVPSRWREDRKESFLLFLSFPRKSAHKMKCLLSLSSHAAFLTCIFHGTNIFMVNNFYLKSVLIKSKAESPLFDMYQKN